MDLTDARTLADTLLTQHGLTEKGWRFDFDNAEKRLGLCTYSRKLISISRKMAAAATRTEVEQTVLHEVAHALSGHAAGHGPAWKAKAASIGYTGRRTSQNPHLAAQQATRAVDAPLEVGARIVTGGTTEGLVTKISGTCVHFRGLNGRRHGKDYRTARSAVVVIAAATDATRDAAQRANNPMQQYTERARIASLTAAAAATAETIPLTIGATIVTKNRGTVGVVTGFGRTNIHFQTPTGQRFSINPSGVTVIEAATATTRAAAAEKPVEVLQEGATVVVDGGGRFGGRTATIVKVNRTRYQLRMLDTTDIITAPFSLVRPA